jgi:uncharacterized protein YbjT (DUF2867 family)
VAADDVPARVAFYETVLQRPVRFGDIAKYFAGVSAFTGQYLTNWRRNIFLITGITGNIGGAAARGLLAQGKAVRALVRDPKKAAAWSQLGVDLVQGDWNDSASIAAALQGVEGAYIMMPPTQVHSRDYREAKAVAASYAQALRESPPPKLVALSSFGAEKQSRLGLVMPPRLLELALEDASFPLALVRAAGLFENFTFGLEAGKTGTLPTFYRPSDRKIAHIATADAGALVVELLTTEWSGRRVIELGRPVSSDEIANDLGEVLGHEVKAVSIPREAWTATLEQMGLPRGTTWAFEELMDGVNSGWIDIGVEGTEKRPGTTTARDVFAGLSQR